MKFGSEANNPQNDKYFTWPIWTEIKRLPRIGNDTKLEEDTTSGLSKMQGTEYSCVLLGPPGIGKGAIVEELWLFNEYGGDNIRTQQKVFYINKTPYEIDSHILEDRGEE